MCFFRVLPAVLLFLICVNSSNPLQAQCWKFTGEVEECSDYFPVGIDEPQYCTGDCSFDNTFQIWICDDQPSMKQYENFDKVTTWDEVVAGGPGDYLASTGWSTVCYDEADCQCVGGPTPSCVTKLSSHQPKDVFIVELDINSFCDPDPEQ